MTLKLFKDFCKKKIPINKIRVSMDDKGPVNSKGLCNFTVLLAFQRDKLLFKKSGQKNYCHQQFEFLQGYYL